ncbi:hypothetical protein [Halosimplex pelagicum]|uniref:Uncharacterized protein n=1 Tax=Halosimplex pelagicum TaxID=869886 RepID=A0A7D5PF85_9EURY|nr:hypothetical protein [Halosimplex pelagicum]QLH82459.1 hypothetical protein HZS54_12915 [Halosimplex pelagicum]QLH82515.1 hypothetical protein HZS54_13220 [Halosimplex pelagicum]
MTEHTTDDTAEWLQSKDTIEATLHVDGDELPIEVEDITRDELDALESQAQEGPDAEDEAIRNAIREYLDEPDVDPDEMPMRKRSVLWFAMQQAWSGVEDIQAAMDEIDLPGNAT